MSKNKFNQNVINTVDNMKNLLKHLYDIKLIYYYNKVSLNIENDIQIISWNNHVSDRINCGSSFTLLQQYQHILSTGAFICILFDYSIIRSSFKFKGKTLISHSHLWWPAPFVDLDDITSEYTPQERYEEFITDPEWRNKLRMRSPIRIDFDPESEKESHPMIHMHTQHHETRIQIDKPICFSKFINYIFQNYYPEIKFNLSDWNMLNYSFQKPKIDKHRFSKILID